MDTTQRFGALLHALQEIFAGRLRALVSYGASSGLSNVPTPTLVVVDTLTPTDLRACATRVAGWHERGLATPLLLPVDELRRSLDAFPMEFSVILTDHEVVFGNDPFEGLIVEREALRRACEVQVRSHLLHLREGYLETTGRSDAIADVIRRSTHALAALVKSVALLERQDPIDPAGAAAWVDKAIGLPRPGLVDVIGWIGRTDVPGDEARELWPRYLEAMTRLADYIDRWGQ